MKKKNFLKRGISILAAVATLACTPLSAYACTTVAVGKDASADGSVIVAHTCDGWYDHRIQIVEGGTHEEGEMVDIYNDPCTATKNDVTLVGQIPQVEETYTYFNIAYPFMNEKGVVMSEFTWNGRSETAYNSGLFVIANLEMLGLQRAATAREAIEVMGALAEEYGYCDGGECLLVADENEIWIFEICGGGPLWTADSDEPGAHWAARRVPDDQVFTGANRSRIGVIDFDDPDNYMWSTDITVLAEQLGWWSEGEEFNYTQIFNPEPYGYMFYASRREWRVFSLLAPSQNFEIVDRYTHYDFSIVPDELVTIQDIMDIYSDHLEGTEYDMTEGEAAGPFGNPTRWQVPSDLKPETGEDWEREIAQYRCSYSFVAQCRDWLPEEIGTVLWFGEDSPDTTVYVPIYAGTTEVPEEWSTGDRKSFDQDCAWWAFNFVNNYANIRWDTMYEDIRAEKAVYEDQFFADQESVEAEALALYEEDPEAAKAYLTEYVCDNMDTVYEGWWDFAWELVAKYYDGMVINEDGTSSNLGYPTEWLEAVGYGQSSLDDQAKLYGEVTDEAEEEVETETDATEAEAVETEPAESPVNTTTNNGTALAIGIVAVIIVAVVAFIVLRKKNKSDNGQD
ncbi:MAG: C69 family dipeptidase [Lachnospiraceae bacterium]|nr:C69 family dipeptidase [Lachnospiraceae bacterium]